jgi:hypothetical protein
MMLPSGHGHGIVIQDFVGDIYTRSDRRANGHQARVVVGSIAKVLKHVIPV